MRSKDGWTQRKVTQDSKGHDGTRGLETKAFRCQRSDWQLVQLTFPELRRETFLLYFRFLQGQFSLLKA